MSLQGLPFIPVHLLEEDETDDYIENGEGEEDAPIEEHILRGEGIIGVLELGGGELAHLVIDLIDGGDALDPGDDVDNKNVTERFFILAGAPVSSYCGDRAAFLGPWRGYDKPLGVERGDLGNIS